METLTAIQALQFLDNICSQALLSRQDHNQVLFASKVIRDELEAKENQPDKAQNEQ